MKHSSEFILLASTRVGESSLVMHALSPQWGRRSFITGLGKASRPSLFLPLSLLEGEVTENPRSELWRAGRLSAVVPLTGLRSDVRKNAMTAFISEVLYRSLREGTLEEGLYGWCRGCILTLDALESDFANFHLRFLLEFAGALGFSPTLEDLAPFAGEHFGVLRELLAADGLTSFLLVPMNGEQRSEVASLLLDYISFHSGTRLQIRSLPVLRELFK